jgi:hypothetical protein
VIGAATLSPDRPNEPRQLHLHWPQTQNWVFVLVRLRRGGAFALLVDQLLALMEAG